MTSLVTAIKAYGLLSAIATTLVILAGCNLADRRAARVRRDRPVDDPRSLEGTKAR